MATKRRMSVMTAVFLCLVAAVACVSVGLTALLVWDSQRTSYAEAERVTQALAADLAHSPTVRGYLRAHPAPEGPGSDLQGYARTVTAASRVSFITIMTPDGLRYTHYSDSEVGKRYRGTIPARPAAHTEKRTGTLGPSVRTIAPIIDDDRRQLGWVSVGLTVDTIGAEIAADLPLALTVSAAVAAVGVGGALGARRYTRRVAGNLASGEVRRAVDAYDSFRVLGDALRAQQHEHGNRMHAVIGLIELGRGDEAIELLSATSAQSQRLVDLIALSGALDPTVSALILGKTAQAAERGVALRVELDEQAARFRVPPMDMVSVLGNLIDNAIEAAARGTATPRTVDLRIRPDREGATSRIDVIDSGDGFAGADAARLFEWGFSTKEQEPDEHGVGLALVGRIVQQYGGTIGVGQGPTRFTVQLPIEGSD